MEAQRREFLGAAIGSLAVCGVARGKGEPNEELVASPPVAMAPRSDGMEFAWSVTRLCRGWIELETESGARCFARDGWGFVPQGEKALRVRMDGLEPGTTYRYRAVTESMEGEKQRVESGWRTFQTLDASAPSTRFCVWNDTHDFGDTLKELDRKTPAADFLVWNGDANQNKWREEAAIPATLLNPGGTDFTARRPLAFAWGNHDARGTCGFRVPGYIATPGGRPFYAFRSGPLAAVVLDTGEDKPDDHPSFKGRVASEPLRREQADWLRREVIGNPALRNAPYRVAFCHIPLRWTDEDTEYSFDHFSKRSRDLWHDALVDWGAQVVVSGHTHRPAKIEASAEFPYAQLIGGGPQPDRATWIEGEADAKSLRLKVRKLTGETAAEMAVAPIGG